MTTRRSTQRVQNARRKRFSASLAGSALMVATGAIAAAPHAAQTATRGAPYVLVDLASNRVIASSQPALLETPMAPGSLMKIAALAAALESGAVTPATAILCRRDVSIDGRRLPCSHPDLHRPLTPADALAHSCNFYFATVASRLKRPAFERALADLGLPAASPSVDLPREVLGLEGVRPTPRALLNALARIAGAGRPLPFASSTIDVLRAGLEGAARQGTASALQAAGVDALAKTGTAPGPGGAPRGLVVAVTPAQPPTLGIALIAPGASGSDAAALAAAILSSRSAIANPRSPIPNPRSPILSPGSPIPVPRSPDAGVIRVGFSQPAGGYKVAELPLETYVARVLAGEAARDSSPAALEALAITIRTFALANLGRHRADGFDLCDLTHCQVVRTATAAHEQAARATVGKVLLFRGAPAQVFYTASCGGRTERPSAVWPGAEDPPFLPARVDPANDTTPWSSELSVGSLEHALAAAGFRGRLRELRIGSRTSSGRVATLRLVGLAPDQISGQDLRVAVGRTLGWQHIKSTAFDLDRTSTGYAFTGHGSGHGVGFCVIGSAALARNGRSAVEILATYFPGLAISRPAAAAVASDITLSLPAGDEGERAAIVSLAERARDDLARQLGVPKPERLTLRFHPTVEAYQRATGQPWYTAGATMDNEIHFVPLTVLRERGVLERTIRHEIVHQLTRQTLAARPPWVQEGVAIYFAGERPVPGPSTSPPLETRRTECPKDEELRRPQSPGALRNAYARAGACVARQIAAGRKWTEVR
jgi:stage II sporulation protein D (peptidoglycan lytic transglycosylase)